MSELYLSFKNWIDQGDPDTWLGIDTKNKSSKNLKNYNLMLTCISFTFKSFQDCLDKMWKDYILKNEFDNEIHIDLINEMDSKYLYNYKALASNTIDNYFSFNMSDERLLVNEVRTSYKLLKPNNDITNYYYRKPIEINVINDECGSQIPSTLLKEYIKYQIQIENYFLNMKIFINTQNTEMITSMTDSNKMVNLQDQWSYWNSSFTFLEKYDNFFELRSNIMFLGTQLLQYINDQKDSSIIKTKDRKIYRGRV